MLAKCVPARARQPACGVSAGGEYGELDAVELSAKGARYFQNCKDAWKEKLMEKVLRPGKKGRRGGIMRGRFCLPLRVRTVVFIGFLASVAAGVFFSGEARQSEVRTAPGAALRRPTGSPQLVSVEPLPALDSEMCQWVPASASATRRAALRQEQMAARAAARDERRTTVDADRAPVRVLRDTYPMYSAVAVAINDNEVFLQDENLFGIRVFNRLDNTPPSASFTEPKRVLAGVKTKMEFNCGLYIDPKTGDLYSVANDVVDTLVVFPRDAKGDVRPMRELETPHRTYGIAVDEEAQELFLTVQYPAEVVVYRKMAAGGEKPLRVLGGDQTELEDAHGIALDTTNGWMFVSNHGSDSKWDAPGTGYFESPSITVHPLKANGNTPPLRIIEGPQTQLNWPAAMAIAVERGELFVANDADDSILVFRETDQGDVAPLRVIKGSRTGIKYPTGIFVDPKNGELWVSNMGNHSATVYPLDAHGNISPRRTIRSAPLGKQALAIGNPGAVAYDSKREELLVPN